MGDLHLAEGVVAQGDNVRAGGKNILGLGGQQTVSRSVFGVDHREVNALFLLQPPQMAAQEGHAALTCYVAHGQHLEMHAPRLRFPSISFQY